MFSFFKKDNRIIGTILVTYFVFAISSFLLFEFFVFFKQDVDINLVANNSFDANRNNFRSFAIFSSNFQNNTLIKPKKKNKKPKKAGVDKLKTKSKKKIKSKNKTKTKSKTIKIKSNGMKRTRQTIKEKHLYEFFPLRKSKPFSYHYYHFDNSTFSSLLYNMKFSSFKSVSLKNFSPIFLNSVKSFILKKKKYTKSINNLVKYQFNFNLPNEESKVGIPSFYSFPYYCEYLNNVHFLTDNDAKELIHRCAHNKNNNNVFKYQFSRSSITIPYPIPTVLNLLAHGGDIQITLRGRGLKANTKSFFRFPLVFIPSDSATNPSPFKSALYFLNHFFSYFSFLIHFHELFSNHHVISYFVLSFPIHEYSYQNDFFTIFEDYFARHYNLFFISKQYYSGILAKYQGSVEVSMEKQNHWDSSHNFGTMFSSKDSALFNNLIRKSSPVFSNCLPTLGVDPSPVVITVANNKFSLRLDKFDAFIKTLSNTYPNFVVQVVDLEGNSFKNNFLKLCNTNLIISVSNERLVTSQYMPPCGALLEIFPVGYYNPQFFGLQMIGSGHLYAAYSVLETHDHLNPEYNNSFVLLKNLRKLGTLDMKSLQMNTMFFLIDDLLNKQQKCLLS